MAAHSIRWLKEAVRLALAPRSRHWLNNVRSDFIGAITAVSQLPYTGAEIAEWLFHQEKAILENAEKCTGIVKPL